MIDPTIVLRRCIYCLAPLSKHEVESHQKCDEKQREILTHGQNQWKRRLGNTESALSLKQQVADRSERVLEAVKGNPSATLEQIGKRFGLSPQRVGQIARRGGVRRQPPHRPLVERAGVVEALRAGEKPLDVARRFRCAKKHVYALRKALGLA